MAGLSVATPVRAATGMTHPLTQQPVRARLGCRQWHWAGGKGVGQRVRGRTIAGYLLGHPAAWADRGSRRSRRYRGDRGAAAVGRGRNSRGEQRLLVPRLVVLVDELLASQYRSECRDDAHDRGEGQDDHQAMLERGPDQLREEGPTGQGSGLRWGQVPQNCRPEKAFQRVEANCVALAAGTPWATRPWYIAPGTLELRPNTSSVKKSPIESGIPTWANVTRIPEAAPR